jgi:hypothetical protein
LPLDIIVDTVNFDEPSKGVEFDQDAASKRLVSWILEKVNQWEDYRDNNYKARWEEYYRIWRGIWKSSDKTRASERSKLIAPALQQAIEMTVAEHEEATFGRGDWFDIADDIEDQQKEDAQITRKLLLEDMEIQGIPKAVAEIYLNGALFGTGIGKILVEEIVEKKPVAAAVSSFFSDTFESVETDRVVVKLEAIPPENFVIDPTARSIDEALGCGHVMVKPKHAIIEKQKSGVYFDVPLGEYIDDIDVSAKGESKPTIDEDKTHIVEYYGLIPKDLLENIGNDTHEMSMSKYSNIEDFEMVEAMVTIANQEVLLKAVSNPFTMQDRPIVAYQHDTVPNRFWGRGIAEKGFNPQKALDAELRARIDGLALSVHPMMAIDSSKMPRGMRFSVGPGKTIMTTGNPNDVLMPFNFGNINNATFHQSGELERMIQMGTGAMDTASPIGVSPRNQTASGMSMIASGAIKRSKRTMQNIERSLLVPMINKFIWRYMQFAPERYKPGDYKFIPRASMGIMAREFEQQQLTNLISTVPPDSPAYWLILKGIFDNSSITNKDEMLQILNMHMQKIMNPKPPPPDPMIEIKKQELQIKSTVDKATLQLEQGKLVIQKEQNALKAREISIKEMDSVADSKKKQADSILSIAKAEAEEIGSQIDQYTAVIEGLNESSARAADEASNKVKDLKYNKSEEDTKILSKLEEMNSKTDTLLSRIKSLEKVKSQINTVTEVIKDIPREGMMDDTNDNNKELEEINSKLDSLTSTLSSHIKDINKPKKIKRDSTGKVISVNGKTPKRNSQGLIEEI